MSWAARLLVAVVGAQAGCYFFPQTGRVCEPGLEVGSVYEVRILEPWNEDSRFEYIPRPEAMGPSCESLDAIGALASIRWRITARTSWHPQYGCQAHSAVPETPLGVDIDEEAQPWEPAAFSARGSVASSDGCWGAWRLRAGRPGGGEGLGVSAVDGELPPFAMWRIVQWMCEDGSYLGACVDEWAGELHAVE